MKKLIQRTMLIFSILSWQALQANSRTEADFLDKMIDHHHKEIALSELALKNSSNRDIQKFAKRVKIEQKKEAEQLKKLKVNIFGSVPAKPLVNLNDLHQKKGPAFDREFLAIMSKNHQEAILFTSKMLPLIESREIHHLAVKIVKKQGNEIEKMDRIKQSL